VGRKREAVGTQINILDNAVCDGINWRQEQGLSRESADACAEGTAVWVEITVPIDPLYLSILVSAEKKFWRCVQTGEVPHLINAEPPRPRIEAIRIVDINSSNSWAEFAAVFRTTARHFSSMSGRKASSRASFSKMQGRRSGTGCVQSARNPVRSALMFWTRRPPVQLSSESLAALAAALAKAQAQLVNPEKSLTATIPTGRAGETQRTFRCPPLEWARDRPQNAERAGDRGHSNYSR
jgi:hypothetical protein